MNIIYVGIRLEYSLPYMKMECSLTQILFAFCSLYVLSPLDFSNVDFTYRIVNPSRSLAKSPNRKSHYKTTTVIPATHVKHHVVYF